MARLKKRKSNPTPGPAAPKPEPEAEAPATEAPGQTAPPAPPPGPPVSDAERSEKDRKLNRLFWFRVALAVIAGTAATFIFEDIEGEERRWASIAFMIIVFLGTVFVAKSMRMQLPSSDRKKIVTQAIGSYVFLYLFTWIVSYTLVHSAESPAGINF